jgi:hypothetical protein
LEGTRGWQNRGTEEERWQQAWPERGCEWKHSHGGRGSMAVNPGVTNWPGLSVWPSHYLKLK